MSEQANMRLSLFSIAGATLRRELLLALGNPGDFINPLTFFVIAVMLFPLGIGADGEALSGIAPGLIWVVSLLAVMLSLEHLFRADYEDGSLEQLLMSSQPLYFMLLAKAFCHWLCSCLPIIALAPLLALSLALPAEGILPLILSLLLGTPALTLLGAVCAALTVGLSRRGLLLTVLVLPLYVPALVFGAGMVDMALKGLPIAGPAAASGALLALTISFAPLAMGAALRISIN